MACSDRGYKGKTLTMKPPLLPLQRRGWTEGAREDQTVLERRMNQHLTLSIQSVQYHQTLDLTLLTSLSSSSSLQLSITGPLTLFRKPPSPFEYQSWL